MLKTLVLIVPIVLCVSIAPLFAVAGDCDGDGDVNSADLVEMSEYIGFGIPIAGDSIDCDCDGHAGLTVGDVLQITQYFFFGASLYPGPSTDIAIPSEVKFYYNSRIDFGGTSPKDSVVIEIDIPSGFDIYGYQIPFCFPTDPGQQDVEVASVDFTGSISPGGSYIDNASKSVCIYDNNFENPSDSKGKLCVVHFNLLSSPTDDPNQLHICYTNRSTAAIFRQAAYAGIDRQRVYMPSFMRARYGDCNSDRTANVSDAVWIINYVFIGGPAPGYYEP
ncbi:MAG: hypothetical protein GWN30_16905 [Gammaproteobacteria bacterium]|nr:hypothetical protein [Gammaproteobacteria bacterium]